MAKERYDHRAIEEAAQKKWAELDLHTTDLTDTSKEPYYLLFEFPYPSGDLHIGHWYAFALTDIYARYLRMQGKNVLFPIGFDAFGLPAENAAIKNGADPREWTYANMERMRSQIRSMGTSVDWSKEVITCEPEYYKWTQWLFSKFYEQKLAERRNAPVKWCPKDKTVLANEQVTDGRCERCGTEVIEKNLTQWFLKITNYADRLLKDLEPLPWREDIKDAQRAWIGQSEGAKLSFALTPVEGLHVEVFTTRPDTVYGATYVVLAPENPLVTDLLPSITNAEQVQGYIKQTTQKTERERQEQKEKTGVQLEGINAKNPATGESIPVYIADYVLASYGTGAVMAVPAHDERDFAFAQKFGLPIRTVIDTNGASLPYTALGRLIDSGDFSDRESFEVMADIVKAADGELITQYRIRDWLVSRQRYWGCPIPVVYDPEGTAHLIPPEHLPWLLPTDVDFDLSTVSGDGVSPLATSNELKERVTRLFGEGWTPEYDTLDTFVDSSWYYLRYLDSHDTHDFSDASLMKRWLPVGRYSGGSEHTTMHLLYARFFHKALFDMALVPTPEPFNERFNRGTILGPDGHKMSKSKGNVINPDDVVQKYGADAVRMYLAFIGPYNEPGHYPWNLDGVEAMRRFLDRIAALGEQVTEMESSENAARALARATDKIGSDTDKFKFNTAISALMILVRDLEQEEALSQDAYSTLLKLLAPFAPHLAEHLSALPRSIHQEHWPEVDTGLLVTAEVTVIVQVNGKKKGELALAPDAPEDEALMQAKALPVVEKMLAESTFIRAIYVPGRIVNLVMGGA